MQKMMMNKPLKEYVPSAKVAGASKKHPGFQKESASIERREGVSKERADAILAASSRNASAAAKKANPRLRRVKG